MARVYAVILAAGRGVRFGSSDNKMFATLCGETVLERSARAFLCHSEITRVVVVAGKDECGRVKALLGARFPQEEERLLVVEGGKTRAQSSLLGLTAAANWETETSDGFLRASDDDCRVLALVHDAARCMVSSSLISAIIACIRDYRCGSAPYVSVNDTIRLLDHPEGSFIAKTLPRNRLAAMQTPQGADLDVMLAAARVASDGNPNITDDIESLRLIGFPVRLIRGEQENIKITRPSDLVHAEHMAGVR